MKSDISLRLAVLGTTCLSNIKSMLMRWVRRLQAAARPALVALLVGGIALAPAQAHAWDIGKAINRAAINVGKSVEKGARDAGRAVEQAAHDTGNAVQTAAQQTGKAIEKGTHDTGNAVQTAAQQTGKAIEKGAHDAGNAIQTAAQQTGKAIEKGAHDVGHYVEEHPLEAALLVAAIGGGAYLVAFQDFNLVVQGVTLVKGGAWAGYAGGAMAGAGTGGLAAGASTMSSPNDGGRGMIIQTTIQTPAAPPPAVAPMPAAGEGNRANPPEARTSVDRPAAPLSDIDRRIKAGTDALSWVERERLLETFRASDHIGLSPAEIRLAEALAEVAKIPDSNADAAAKAQQKEREEVLEKVVRGLKTPTSEAPQILIAEFLKSVGKQALLPTITGDGQAAAREHQLKLLQEKLEAFRLKRVVQGMAEGPSLPQEMPPQGPVMRAP